MQTTSLEVSRELEKAGFWDGKAAPDYWHWLDMGGGVRYRPLLTNGYLRAATYGDLIPALGLDEPWKDMEKRHGVNYGGSTNADLVTDVADDHGFNCDPLAKLWMELHPKGTD